MTSIEIEKIRKKLNWVYKFGLIYVENTSSHWKERAAKAKLCNADGYWYIRESTTRIYFYGLNSDAKDTPAIMAVDKYPEVFWSPSRGVVAYDRSKL